MTENRTAEPTNPPTTILVIDDHQMVAESIVRALRGEPDLEVVGIATTGAAGLDMARIRQPDVVVIDLNLPDLDGAVAARQLRQDCPATHVVLITGYGGDEAVLAAIEAGCVGYVEKARGFDELARAVRLAAVGEMVLPTGRLEVLIPKLMAKQRSTEVLGLTRRETEVLELMADGLANKAIATRLGLRLNTVRNHVQNLLVKLDAHSKLEAVAVATRAGLLQPRSTPARRVPTG